MGVVGRGHNIGGVCVCLSFALVLSLQAEMVVGAGQDDLCSFVRGHLAD